MLTTTSGFVLRKIPYTGSSVILHVYTKRHGLMAFMVRGGTKKGSSTRTTSLQALTLVEITFLYREKNQMQTASTISLSSGYAPGNDHPGAIPISLFLAEMLYKSLREESGDEELFEFIVNALNYFNGSDFSPDFHLIFLMKMTRYLGFMPDPEQEENCPYFDLLNGIFVVSQDASLHTMDEAESVSFCLLIKAEFANRLSISNVQRRKLLTRLIEYYQLHLEGLGDIKSLPILIEVFSARY